jgi:hypothetical protein
MLVLCRGQGLEFMCVESSTCCAWLPPGLRAAVEPAREGDPQQSWLQPEPALPVEVPLHGQGGVPTGLPSDYLAWLPSSFADQRTIVIIPLGCFGQRSTKADGRLIAPVSAHDSRRGGRKVGMQFSQALCEGLRLHMRLPVLMHAMTRTVPHVSRVLTRRAGGGDVGPHVARAAPGAVARRHHGLLRRRRRDPALLEVLLGGRSSDKGGRPSLPTCLRACTAAIGA